MTQNVFLPHIVYLDTEPLRAGNWPLISKKLRRLAEVAGQRGISICLPAPVERELENQFRRDWNRLTGDWQRFSRTLSATPEEWPISEQKDTLSRYSEAVAKTKSEMGLTSVPFATRPIEDFFEDVLLGVSPFRLDSGSKNFKDAVILHSVLEHLQNSQGSLAYFVTADKDHVDREYFIANKTLMVFRDVQTVTDAIESGNQVLFPELSRLIVVAGRFADFDLISNDIVIVSRGAEGRASPADTYRSGASVDVEAYYAGSYLGIGPARIRSRSWPRIFYAGSLKLDGTPIVLRPGINHTQFTCEGSLRGAEVNWIVSPDPVFHVSVSGGGTALVEVIEHPSSQPTDLLVSAKVVEFRFDTIKLETV